jgi:formylglycine-generating enzyme required for sulfatase activity/energy-coupling factor transporter ATP-binding protein EcfA2
MDPSLLDLIDRLNELPEQFEELRQAVRKAIRLADDDPEMALTRVRKVLDYVVRDAYRRLVNEPPGTRPLQTLIQRLVKDGHLPLHLEPYVTSIRELGNAGTHYSEGKYTTKDVTLSLVQLRSILDWYCRDVRADVTASSESVDRTDSAAEPLERPQKRRIDDHVAVVPKGLRSFDAKDSNFFLQLLPGPRDQDGLPESIRFWKHRIEATDDLSFTVGVIYGPSGCGKSSLVKAGLLPRLSKNIISVYVEATSDGTEARLLNGLRRRFPDLLADLDLTQTIAALREGHGLKPQQKVLIVLDQFEQWLHAKRHEQETELARALRQCDGDHAQCILMVRDDFWVALTRFMSDLHIELLQGQNAALVDLFDLMHARKVLAEFGKAFGRLPDPPEAPSKDQNTFLTNAVEGLAQDGRVISIRLALFAEMVKGKSWTPATLKQVGGTQGVGVTFLEETFGSASLRSHQEAAQGVLKALLPESGSNIRGHMQSHEELLRVSGYSDHPERFGDLLRTLDGELRLITPSDPEGSGGERPAGEGGGRYYQLTHDYLVPSLREWLTRKQKETRRGRAELLLADRFSLWDAKHENRHLPSLLEWVNIRLFTRQRDWRAPQRTMMKRAGRVHGVRGLVALLLLMGATFTVLTIRHRVNEANSETYAFGLVQQLLKAEIDQVPEIVRAMPSYRRWTDPELKRIIGTLPDGSGLKLHASLALLPFDSSQLPFLEKHLLDATPAELPVLRDALKPHRSTLIPKLWSVLDSSKPGDVSLLPAASALADYETDSPRWESVGGKVAQALVSVNPVYLGPWLDALRPVRGKLNAPLAAIFRDKKRPGSERNLATNILTDYASDDPDLIAKLLMDADPKVYASLFPIAQEQAAKTLPLFQAELAKKPTYSWNDPPLDPFWTTPDSTLTGKIESAQGMLTGRFAFCQTMPLEEFLTTAEAIRPSGYRPTRFRPYLDGQVVRVVAVWTRDERNWRISSGLTVEEVRQQDERNKQEKFLPVDVAGYIAIEKDGKPADRFAALWVEKSGDDDARLYVGMTADEVTEVQDRLEEAKLIPRTQHAMIGAEGRTRYCGVWGRPPGAFITGLTHRDHFEGSFEQLQADLGDQFLIDVAVSGATKPQTSRDQAQAALESTDNELKTNPDDLDARFSRAMANFRLGKNQKALDDLQVVIGKNPEAVSARQYRVIALARLDKKQDAKSELEKFQKGDATEHLKLYLAAVVAAELGEGADKAFETLEAAIQKQPKDADLRYDAACAFSLASKAVSRSDKAKGRQLAERCLQLLREAIKNDEADFREMGEDSDLDPIRDDPAFTEIMKAGHSDRRYAAVWTSDASFEATPIYGLDPAAHLRKCRELIAQSYRPVSWSASQTATEGPLVTASVWHCPVITEETRDRLAERQARAGVALVRMDKAEEVWPLLRHSADPRLRSYIVNWLNALGADPKLIVAELDRIDPNAKPTPAEGQQLMDSVLFHPETSMRRALILALGTYGTEGLSPGEREPLINKLLDLYRNDPDSGIHGAAEWTLRQWKQQEKLKELDAELMKLKDWGERRWYVNGQGQTFAVIDGPVEFLMGSPPTEPDHGHQSTEALHRRRINRRFALAIKEVSIEQYQRFRREKIDRYSPDPEGPMNGPSWYAAAAYCNWLSERERLDKAQWCYEPNDEGEYAEGMSIPADVLKRTGYRLPTEAEWEYACRAGAVTSRYYGVSVELLGQYVWFDQNSRERAWPCGQVKPNDLGLFDMLGNIFEWCLDEYGDYPSAQVTSVDDIINTSSHVNLAFRRLRGGSFNSHPADVRSAYRVWDTPALRGTSTGFRPSRTYP